ncbi:MAG: phospho-N-acetylmuramoyl-pentapeptide-transferase [Micrococcaceae bacterium]
MIEILLAGFLALIISLLGTPLYIKRLQKAEYGQFIREDGPDSHHVKRGTPTMGGVVIVASVVLSYFFAHLVFYNPPSASGLVFLFLVVGMCIVGFLDDYLKISRKQNLGLTEWTKICGQLLVGTLFAILAINFPDKNGITPASEKISFIRDINWLNLALWGIPAIGLILFILWSNLIIVSISNGVNLADGLDGLAAGAAALVFSAYLIMTIFQSFHDCQRLLSNVHSCYEVRDPRDLSVLSAALVGACVGFLWWNTNPAQIFMGDTGSLSLGAAIGGLAILTHTELMLPILGGLFVTIASSVLLQVGYFKYSGGKRLFKMAPLQHHFEILGWKEVTIVVRFWIACILFVAVALGFFFAEWVTVSEISAGT